MKENKRDFLEDLLQEDFQYGVDVPPVLNEKILQAASRQESLEEKKNKKTFPQAEPPVSFSARAYPFLQLLKAANKKKKDIYWGIWWQQYNKSG